MLVAALDESHKSLPGLANYAVRKSQNDEKTLKKLLENKVAMEKILDQIVDSSNAILLAQENTVAKQGEKFIKVNTKKGIYYYYFFLKKQRNIWKEMLPLET